MRVFGTKDGECQSGVLRSGRVVRYCEQPAVVLMREGCVHEHLFDVWLCEKHAVTERGYCNYCRRLDESHICKLLAVRVEKL